MAEKPAVSSGPVVITDSQGRQSLIPLTSLYFDGSGKIKADRWPQYAAEPQIQSRVDNWLGYLVAQGLVTPGTTPPRKPAFQLKATDTGANGNTIVVEISNVLVKDPPEDSTADIAVTETDTYTRLTTSSLATVLGTAGATPTAGTHPGLVALASTAPAMPSATSGALAGSPPQFDAGGAFTLQAKRDDAEATATSVEIKDVDTVQNSFTLIAVWAKSKTGLALSAFNTEFGYVVQVSSPISAAPGPGTVTLVGGADPVSVTGAKAEGTVLAGS